MLIDWRSWSVEEVCIWLEEHHLHKVSREFRKAKIKGKNLKDLDKQALETYFPQIAKADRNHVLFLLVLLHRTSLHNVEEDTSEWEKPSQFSESVTLEFVSRPFGFQVAIAGTDSDDSVSLPCVHNIINAEIESAGVEVGMVLISINGEPITPGVSLKYITNQLNLSPLPCIIVFAHSEENLTPLKVSEGHFRYDSTQHSEYKWRRAQNISRKGRRTRRRQPSDTEIFCTATGVIVPKVDALQCTDCRQWVRDDLAIFADDQQYYCGSCHGTHVCQSCDLWSDEVNTKLNVDLCSECFTLQNRVHSEKFITFQDFPFPFSIKPLEDAPRLHEVDEDDGTGLGNGWIITTVNDKSVRGLSAAGVIKVLASENFPMRLGFTPGEKKSSAI